MDNKCKTREIFKNNLSNFRGIKSVNEVAKAIGISQSYMQEIENGQKKTPSFEMMEKIADYYEVTVSDLLKEWD